MGGQFGIISTGGPYGQMGGQSQKGVKSVGTFSGVLGANCRGRGGGEQRAGRPLRGQRLSSSSKASQLGNEAAPPSVSLCRRSSGRLDCQRQRGSQCDLRPPGGGAVGFVVKILSRGADG